MPFHWQIEITNRLILKYCLFRPQFNFYKTELETSLFNEKQEKIDYSIERAQ